LGPAAGVPPTGGRSPQAWSVSSDARTGVPSGVAWGVGSLPGTGAVEARRRPDFFTVGGFVVGGGASGTVSE
jgi:hypothetical protein